jgi:hypothetical protein
MFKRAVRVAVTAGGLAAAELAEETDGALMERLFRADPTGLARAVHERRLYKRAIDLPASEVPADTGDWIADDPELLQRVEDAIAAELGFGPAAVLLDYPARANMLAVDLPLKTREGRIERLTGEGRAGHLGLPRIAEELYQSARRLRVFAAGPLPALTERVVALVGRGPAELRDRLARGQVVLG